MSTLAPPATGSGNRAASRPVDDDLGHAPRANLGQLPADERFLTWGARFAALGIAWVAVERLLPVHGIFWFIFVAAVANVVILAVGTAALGSNVAVADRVAQWVISTGMVIVLVALGSVIVFVLHRGWSALHHVNFFTKDMSGVGAEDPLSHGGILHAILGSLIELSIASAIALPLGIGTAVYMNEIGGKFARVVRTVVEAMTALPDILAGLFIYTIWIIALGYPRSGLAAGFAITVMMLPIIARASDVVLRVVPGTMREAAFALGASRWATVWRIVLPTARPGLATALILAIARGVGETAPVLITSGNAPFVHLNPTSGVMNSLPLFIFTSARSGIALQVQRAFGAAAVLLLLVLVLFITARLLARQSTGKPSLFRRVRRVARFNSATLMDAGLLAGPSTVATVQYPVASPDSTSPPAPDEETQ